MSLAPDMTGWKLFGGFVTVLSRVPGVVGLSQWLIRYEQCHHETIKTGVDLREAERRHKRILCKSCAAIRAGRTPEDPRPLPPRKRGMGCAACGDPNHGIRSCDRRWNGKHGLACNLCASQPWRAPEPKCPCGVEHEDQKPLTVAEYSELPRENRRTEMS